MLKFNLAENKYLDLFIDLQVSNNDAPLLLKIFLNKLIANTIYSYVLKYYYFYDCLIIFSIFSMIIKQTIEKKLASCKTKLFI